MIDTEVVTLQYLQKETLMQSKNLTAVDDGINNTD